MVSPELSTSRAVLQNADSQSTSAVSLQHLYITDLSSLNKTVIKFRDQMNPIPFLFHLWLAQIGFKNFEDVCPFILGL